MLRSSGLMASCTIEDVTDAFDAASFDGSLGDLLIACDGDVDTFLGTVLGFLARRTNWLQGPDPKRRLLDAYRATEGDSKDAFKPGFLAGAAPSAPSTVPSEVRALLLFSRYSKKSATPPTRPPARTMHAHYL